MKIEEIMNDEFPVGMRVLVVDDDPYYMKKFEILLRKCGYQVTAVDQATKALKMLRENKNEFDLVISDVKTRDMDGFDLLKVLALEMDLPVIMLSSHDDKELVMKGITHGACDYLLKPVRIEVLKIIWQHVVRKKSNSKKWENFQKPRGEFGEVQELKRTENVDHNNHPDKKRKYQDIEEREDYNEKSQDQDDDPSTHKKARVVWTSELHEKFVAAVNTLGVDQAVPKRILEMMNDEKITRENVASHLQKYRQRLKKFSSVGSDERVLGQVDNMRNVPGAWNTPYPAPWNSSSSSGLAVGSHFSESSGVPQWGQTDNLMNKTQHETNIRHSSTQNMGHRTHMPLQFDSREQNKDLTLVARNSAVHFDDTLDSTFNVNRSRKCGFANNSAVFENRPSVSARSLNSDSSSIFPNSGGFIDNRPIVNQSTRFYHEQSRLVGTRDYRSNVGIMSPEVSSFHPGSNAVPHTRTHSQINMNHNLIHVHNINQVVYNQSSHLHANPLMLHPDNTNLLCQSPGLQLNEDDLKLLRDADLGEMITEPLDNATDRLEAREATYEH